MDDWSWPTPEMDIANSLGLQNDPMANSNGADSNQFYGTTSDIGNNGGGNQYGDPYAPAAPVCVNSDGTECVASSYWRQRAEEVMTETNRRFVTVNNYMAVRIVDFFSDMYMVHSVRHAITH